MPYRHTIATRSAIYTGCLARYLPRLFNTNIYLSRFYANKHSNHLHRHHQSTFHTSLLSNVITMSEDDDTMLRRTVAHRGIPRPTARPNQENEQTSVAANNGAFARPNVFLANAQRPTRLSTSPPRTPLLLRRNVTAPFNRPITPVRAGIARRMSPEEKSLASRFIIQESARRAQNNNTDEPNSLPDHQSVTESPTSPSPSQSRTQGVSASLVQDDEFEVIDMGDVAETQAGPSQSVSDVNTDALVTTPSPDQVQLLDDDEGPKGYSAPCPTPPSQRERSHLIELFGRASHMVRTGRLSMDRVIQAINEGRRQGIENRKRQIVDPDVLTAALLKYLDEKEEYQ